LKLLKIKNRLLATSLLTAAALLMLTGCGRKDKENDENYYDEKEDDEYYEDAEDIKEDPCTDDTWTSLDEQREILTDLFANAQDMQDAGKIEVTDEFNKDMDKAADLINYFCEYKQKDISENMAATIKDEMAAAIASLQSYTQE